MRISSLRLFAALAASLSLAFSLVVPLCSHTCPLGAAPRPDGPFLCSGTGARPSDDPADGICLACALASQLTALAALAAAVDHVHPPVARAACALPAVRTLQGTDRHALSRGPPLVSS